MVSSSMLAARHIAQAGVDDLLIASTLGSSMLTRGHILPKNAASTNHSRFRFGRGDRSRTVLNAIGAVALRV